MTTKHGFELLREQHIDEYNAEAQLWRHIKTGAQLLSISNDDENKVFGITFRTPVDDATGVAHILEHAVLAGSRKYPVKEPFVELLKGSLNTFVNAFTFPDKTCYPIASQNVQDFYNLIDVYLDAVFYPLLKEHIFEQEGWHYELENLADPLVFKGIVFNEMKGAYSSPDRVLGEAVQHALFPDTIYKAHAGGLPRNIPDLTYEFFKNFHQTYYHPSNSRIYFYGDDDAEQRLKLLDEWLSNFEQQEAELTITLQPKFDAPKSITRTYAAGDEDAEGNKAMMTTGWLLSETTDVELNLGLSILDHVLTGMTASPLRKALLNSELGEDLTGGGLDDELRQIYFSTGLKGIAAENSAKVEALIDETLQELAENGIDPETVKASLNTLEFTLRENNTGSFPRGLVLMLRALNTWLYDGDPLAPLMFEEPLQKIKSRVEAGEPYFENLFRHYLLENPHRVTVLLTPDAGQGEREMEEEKGRLAAKRSSLSEQELQEIIDHTAELKRLQSEPDSPEALATIPMLSLDDLEKENKILPLEVSEANGARVLYHDLFTNGIAYLDVGLDLHLLEPDLVPYVPLFGRALLEMGAGSDDFVQLSQRIGRDTGGIGPQMVTVAIRGTKKGEAWLFLRGKVVAEQGDKLLALLQDVLLHPRLDNRERFRQIVLEEKAGEESKLSRAGHQVANIRVRAHYDEAGWATEQTDGVSYLLFLRTLATAIENSWTSVRETLERLQKTLVNRSAMLINATLDAENWAAFRPGVESFLAALPASEAESHAWPVLSGSNAEGLTIPARVNYVGQGANLYDLGYELHGSQAVITNFLNTTWMWERIRVQGGAYGGFAVFDLRSGVWSYLSYRDPNLLGTLDTYAGTANFLQGLDLTEAQLTSAIIGAIGSIDAYQLPDAKGWTSLLRYFSGDTDEDRQQRRDEVLATGNDDFHKLGEVLSRIGSDAPIAVLGGLQAIEAANKERPGLLEVVQIL